MEVEARKEADETAKFFLANDSDEAADKVCESDDKKIVGREIFHETFSHAIRLVSFCSF